MEWFDETLHANIGQRFKVDEILHRQKTDFQDLVIFRNDVFGRVMALDGVIQTTEGDEFVYHEMMAHVPLFAQLAAKGTIDRVLIIGGGDGGVLREVLRHPQARPTMVEIDRSVVDMCVRHLPNHSAGAFDNPRSHLVIADGARFVKETSDRYDVIIVDSTDPIGPGAVLFTEEFYADCKRCLTPGGVLVTQNGVPFLQGDEVTTSDRHFRKLFDDAAFYVAPIPTYYGGFMTLGWATDNPALRRQPLAAITELYRDWGQTTQYFTPDIYVGAFCLPAYVQRLLGR